MEPEVGYPSHPERKPDMSSINDHSGYNQEEAAFKQKEQEALARLRSDLDRKRQTTASSEAKAAHWMCCPKCGGKLAEKRFEVVMIDQCGGCGGVYFDAGELELLIKHEKAAGKGSVLGKLFGR
jgi:ribosomal protein L37AE/L43A